MQTIKFFNNTSFFASPEIDNLWNVYLKIAAHSVSKGAMEGIRGGHFEHGFFVGMASAASGSVLNGGMCDRLSAAERIAVNAVLGGIVSELGGGKFASGAMTAAYVMMFNELKHGGPTYRQLKKIYEIETASIETMSPQEFYQMLGGEIAQKALEFGWENACAARLCYAMNESGLKILYIKGVTCKDINGRNYITLASDMKKYFNKIWGTGLYCKKSWTLKNGITFQNNLAGVSGHVDVIYKGKSAAYATEYHKEMKTVETIIWKY